MSPRRAGGAGTLARLRGATAAQHDSIDGMIETDRLTDAGYYAAVIRGLIGSAEIVEVALPLMPPRMCAEGLSPTGVSKRRAIDAEEAFVNGLVGPGTDRRRPAETPFGSGPLTAGTTSGLLYVYIGSALGGLQLLRVARTAPWWRPEREHVLLRPYGDHLHQRWRALLSALERLDPGDTGDAVEAAHTGFDVFRRSLVDQLEAGGVP